MKQLQERVIELENQNKRRKTDSRILIKKYSQVCSREEETTSCDETRSHISTPPLPQVEARVLEKEVLIGIHCHKQKDIVLKIMALLQNHHLSLASSSVLPFGSSTLKVTIIAQVIITYFSSRKMMLPCTLTIPFYYFSFYYVELVKTHKTKSRFYKLLCHNFFRSTKFSMNFLPLYNMITSHSDVVISLVVNIVTSLLRGNKAHHILRMKHCEEKFKKNVSI